MDGSFSISQIPRVTICRDARKCLVGGRPSPSKPTVAVTFDTTDARPSVPTQGYSSHETCQHLLFEEDGVVAYRVLQDS